MEAEAEAEASSMGIDRMKKLFSSEEGTVAFEFILMLPIYMLLIGGTLLIFDLTMGILHLQEANRNLAWVAGDRHFKDIEKAKERLNASLTQFYEDRNKRETLAGAGTDYWLYGENKRDLWGVNVVKTRTGAGLFEANTPWGMLAAGNMELGMNRVSSIFLGLIAVSSAFSDDESIPKLYDRSFKLTRTEVPDSGSVTAGDGFRPESYLYRRSSRKTERDGTAMENVISVIGEPWPNLDDNVNTVQPATGTTTATDDSYKRVLAGLAQ